VGKLHPDNQIGLSATKPSGNCRCFRLRYASTRRVAISVFCRTSSAVAGDFLEMGCFGGISAHLGHQIKATRILAVS
jgi:hypothetical protein